MGWVLNDSALSTSPPERKTIHLEGRIAKDGVREKQLPLALNRTSLVVVPPLA
jgi:hypothetical protein